MSKHLQTNKHFLVLLFALFMGVSGTANLFAQNITFADANVKVLCVANWDTNGDGELSYMEAAAVTTLNNEFSFNDALISFDELQYFIGLTSLNDYEFYFCTNLTSVSIPETVASIGNEAFSDCSSLSSITSLAMTPPTLGNNVFDGVPSTVTVNVPSCSIENYQSAAGWNYFSNYAGLIHDLCPITFADANVKAICVANWDTNGDGELSYAEAAAVTTLNPSGQIYQSVFKGNITITSFDELRYFTGLTSIENSAFQDCSSLTSIEIPNSVTSIGDSAFSNCYSLTSIEIPNSVTSIGSYAFYGCSSLTSIEIPNSVTSIGSYAFYGCSSLTSIEIPNSVTSIGNRAFELCSSLTSVEIPNSVTSIGNRAFDFCSSLTSVEIPNSVTSIGVGAFSGCSSLANVIVDNDNTVYDSRDNCNAIIETNTNILITGCKNTVIPNSVTSIGEGAFSGCYSLISIEIPNSVTSIGNSAFESCSSLTSIEIPNSVTSIGSYAFSDCISLISIEIPNSVTSIRSYAFSGCYSLTSIEIPNSVKSIRNNAFEFCSSLTSIEIPNSVTSIGSYAFYGCSSLTSIEIPNSVPSIGSYAFSGCYSLISIEIPNSVTSIGQSAFEFCSSLTSIEIPNSVTSIGNRAFRGCSSLTSIEIPNSVTSIGSYAFYGCSSLTSIKIYATTPPTLENTAFDGVPSSTLVYVPCGTIEAYQASGWNYFSNFEEFIAGDYCAIDFIDDQVKAICVAQWDTNGDGELSYAEAAAVTNLGTYFKNNTTITSFYELQYFTSVTTLPTMAFMGCTNLTTISLPSSMTTLSTASFFNCTSLAAMTVYAETPPTTGSNTFGNVPTNMRVYVPCGTSATFQTATGWSNFSNIVDMCTYNCTVDPENVQAEVLSSYTETKVSWTSDNYLFELRYRKGFVEGFENGILGDWATIDADGDGYSWSIGDPVNNEHFEGHNSNQCVSSASYINSVGVLHPDNYLVTPQISLGGVFGFWACAQDASYAAEHFGVAVSTGSQTNPEDFVMLQEWTMTAKGSGPKSGARGGDRAQGNWYHYSVNLSAYAGQTGYIAIRHFNCSDWYWLNVDDIEYQSVDEWTTVTGIIGTSYTLTGLEEMSDYVVAVRSSCGDGVNYSNWVGTSFSNKHYTVTVDADPYEGGTVTGDGEYLSGATCTLTATPNDGYVFVNWTKNGQLYSWNSTTYVIGESDIDLEANFVKVKFPLTESFDNYTVGNVISMEANAADANRWTTWSGVLGGAEEGVIALLGDEKCAHFTYGNDQVFLLGNVQTGRYTISFDMYIPEGKDAYNNLLHVFTGAENSQWCTQVYYKTSSNGTSIQAGGVTTYFECPYDEWFNVKYVMDLDEDIITFYVGEVEVVSWQFSLQSGGATGTRRLAALDFYPPTNANSEYYLDNLTVTNTAPSYMVNAISNPTGFGTIVGSGSYDYGTTCTLTATPSEGYFFENWTKNGEVVSTDNPLVFTVTGDAEYVANFELNIVTQTIDLHEGWNWVSTYIDMNTVDGLTKIKEALGDNAQTIQTFDNFAENFGGGVWVGLEDYTMTNQEMIMIDAVNDCQITLQGLAVDPSTVTITIKPQEWTWIGFPVGNTTDLLVALNGFEPEFDDIIQGFAGFVSYFGDADGWIGDFAELEPGQGYMYFSNSTTPKTLTFHTGAKVRRVNPVVKKTKPVTNKTTND